MTIITTTTEDCATIRLSGRFDANCRNDVMAAATAAIAGAAPHVRIDLGNVEYIDSTALGLLLAIRNGARQAGKAVSLANARGPVLQVLSIPSP